MAAEHIDYAVLYQRLVERRGATSWRVAAMEAGVPAGTFSRLKQGKGCSDHAFVTLMSWLGADESIRPFLRRKPEPEPVAVEEDPAQEPEAA
jgi:hypothetical protein